MTDRTVLLEEARQTADACNRYEAKLMRITERESLHLLEQIDSIESALRTLEVRLNHVRRFLWQHMPNRDLYRENGKAAGAHCDPWEPGP
jgi:hypothetical protein